MRKPKLKHFTSVGFAVFNMRNGDLRAGLEAVKKEHGAKAETLCKRIYRKGIMTVFSMKPEPILKTFIYTIAKSADERSSVVTLG